MKQSESISKLATALAAVQGKVTPIAKDATNPHFRNKYASLDAIMEAVRPLLVANGLSVVQGGGAPVSNVDGNVTGVSVETMLVHASGEYIASTITLPLDKPTAQAVGGAITYGRRYGVAALLALTTEEDDDGTIATATRPVLAAAQQAVKPVANGQQDYGKVSAPAPQRGERASGTDEVSHSAKPTDDPECPKCGASMWDNRVGKRNPKAPDFKCKDNSCDGVIWPPKPTRQQVQEPEEIPF